MDPIVNTNDIQYLISIDSVINDIYNRHGEPPNWQRKPGFESLSKFILGQQLSLESAEAHFNKLKNYINEFTVENILKLSDDEMRSCFISRQKSKYLRELAQAVVDQKLIFEELEQLDENQIREKLTAIKGIGNWTADIYMLFCLQNKDVFPIGDLAIVNSIKKLYSVSEKDEILKISERWKPFRSLGTFFIWHEYLRNSGRSAIF